MSKEELLEQLDALTERLRRRESDVEGKALIHDLQVHQIELEMQNRELQESQQALEASRSRYADLYDFAPAAYVTVDERCTILEANLTAAKILGIARSQLTGMSLLRFVERAHHAALQAALRRSFDEMSAAAGEITLSVGKRAPIAVQFAAAPYPEPGGKLANRIALTDISALKSAEQTLHFLVDASEILASSLDCEAGLARVVRKAVPVLADICLMDLVLEGDVLRRVESAFADPDLRHLAQGPASGVDWRSAQIEVLRTGAPIHVTDAADSPALRDPVNRWRIRSLVMVPISARDRTFGVLSLFRTSPGRPFDRDELGVAQDLAHRAGMALDNARLYEEAQNAVRTRDNVIAVVAHDLNNPLGSIGLHAEAMMRRTGPLDQEAHARSCTAIRRSVQQMTRLIRDLVDVGSLEDRRLSVVREEHDVGEILQQTRDLLLPLATRSAINLTVELPEATWSVFCDLDRIVQVLSNIAGNAVKFTPAGGSVLLRTVRGESEVVFVVEDTGPGIPAEDQPYVFDRFWRGRAPNPEGRGLGLYIAKGIIEAHGGRIWAQSRPDRGTSMSFALPLRTQDEPERPGPIHRPPAQHAPS
jgi:PAS domain S-box-containing protein